MAFLFYLIVFTLPAIVAIFWMRKDFSWQRHRQILLLILALAVARQLVLYWVNLEYIRINVDTDWWNGTRTPLSEGWQLLTIVAHLLFYLGVVVLVLLMKSRSRTKIALLFLSQAPVFVLEPILPTSHPQAMDVPEGMILSFFLSLLLIGLGILKVLYDLMSAAKAQRPL